MLHQTGCPSSPNPNSHESTPDHQREVKRQKRECPELGQPSGQKMDWYMQPRSPTNRRLSNPRLNPMDIQRLLSVLKVINSSILDLTCRIEAVESSLNKLTEQLTIEFEIAGSDDESDDESDESDESTASAQSAPASFQLL